MKKVELPIEQSLKAKTHPPMYSIHKYWARKPYNIINNYIKYFTNKDDIVMDPFCGSGVVIGEALKLGRKALGIDLNPISTLITSQTVKKIDLYKLQKIFKNIENKAKVVINDMYKAKCPVCNRTTYVSQYIWKGEKTRKKNQEWKIITAYVRCDNCRKTIKREVKKADLNILKIIEKKRATNYPKNIELHPTATRSVKYIHELFTKRAILSLLYIKKEIIRIKDKDIQAAFLLIFSSALAQASKLNSIDLRENREGQSRGWTINNYWIPVGFLEQNVWDCFRNRYERYVRGKNESNVQIKSCSQANNFKDFSTKDNLFILTQSCNKLSQIPDDSVDYIFTDPPYGESIPYLGLSLMWGAWLNLEKKFDFSKEVLMSERGDLEYELKKYKDMLTDCFKEIYRVLKPKAWMSLTFHNRNIRIWNALLNAAGNAGFEFINDVYQIPAVISAKAQLSRSGSMTGDVILNFRKVSEIKSKKIPEGKIEELIIQEAKQIIMERRSRATTDQIMRGVIHILVKNLILDRTEDDIVKILSKNFVEIEKNIWTIQQEKKEKTRNIMAL